MQKPTKKSAKRTAKTIVHPTAIVHPKARLGAGVVVGPYTVIDAQVSVGPRTRIGAHCVIEGRTMIGEECEIFTGAVIGSPPQDLKYRGEASELIIGDRNKIREYVTLNPGTEGGGGKTIIGSDCLLMAYAHVAHDCIVGSRVIIANSAALAGHITVEDRATIGGLVGVHQFVRVGTLAFIGGCSRVVQDVPPYATCVGYPAKVFGLNSEGLRRAGVSEETRRRLHRAFRVLFHSRLSMSHALQQVTADMDSCPELRHLTGFIQASKRGVCRA
ncbi:MAG: acyl-[acyl-carrier-protein]--UDP-N-acetylglucosamine O-acyltransferase [Candidatus Omnitrophica bacterium CG11_big_fil_rev_8_21_14_0_20_63_9]|nr:MAG: acyl-[acyl-carrier-protein]--UDP-N-acetylglucosamine O-acyltransferase [Candidatus Omnitrophica bacterium CG11_big_fil_rev_8_21_14_0_20_63_9]